MPVLRKKAKEPELGSLRQQMLEAEERSWALLRALVDPKDWNGDLNNPIQFTGASGNTYQIYVHSGTVENIVYTDRAGYRRRMCAAPYVWNDYATAESTRRGTHVPGDPLRFGVQGAAWSAGMDRSTGHGWQ